MMNFEQIWAGKIFVKEQNDVEIKVDDQQLHWPLSKESIDYAIEYCSYEVLLKSNDLEKKKL